MSKSVEDRLAELEAVKKLFSEEEKLVKLKEEYSKLSPEELKSRQAIYQVNTQNNLMIAEMLSRTGKMKETSEALAAAEKEHQKFLQTMQAALPASESS